MTIFERKRYTGVNTIKSEFIWSISSFSRHRKDPRHKVEFSPAFNVDESENYFNFEFVPSGNLNDPVKYKSVNLVRDDNHDDEFVCSCKVSFFVEDKTVLIVARDRCVFKSGFRKSVDLIPVYNLLHPEEEISNNDVLKIFCEFVVEKPMQVQDLPGMKFFDLFKNKHLSDVMLRTECGSTFPAHKVLLASVSPVFAAMFKSDMSENEENVIKISDIRYEVLLEMLRYIYLGIIDVKKDTETCCELLGAADKYDIQGLRKKCEQVLCSCLLPENAINIYRSATAYNAPDLKEEVVKFMKENASKIINSNEMKNLVNPEGSILIELMFN
ncbi:hypothetical protein TKK_0010590 [Trichogramma kaykai]|uniref:BTB domain-containing protein n=1 Tax=Trichogramma kaykai TaxID=54128 RepID=A0ABD2WVC7_9HYME